MQHVKSASITESFDALTASLSHCHDVLHFCFVPLHKLIKPSFQDEASNKKVDRTINFRIGFVGLAVNFVPEVLDVSLHFIQRNFDSFQLNFGDRDSRPQPPHTGFDSCNSLKSHEYGEASPKRSFKAYLIKLRSIFRRNRCNKWWFRAGMNIIIRGVISNRLNHRVSRSK